MARNSTSGPIGVVEGGPPPPRGSGAPQAGHSSTSIPFQPAGGLHGAGTSSRGAIEKAFTPEFRNRLDAKVTFASLGRPEILKVVDKNPKELQAMLTEKGVTLQVSQPAREWLADALLFGDLKNRICKSSWRATDWK